MRIDWKFYRVIAKILMAVVILAVAGVLAFVGFRISGRNKLSSAGGDAVPELNLSRLADPLQGKELHEDGALPQEDPADNWQEGDVRYQGVHYRYNEEILTFLFLGIDKMSEVKPVKNGIDGGQSDAIFLLVLDPRSKDISMIAIPRDTMAEIEVYDDEGAFERMAVGQLALQHGYGDGAAQSCERSEAAVRRLFYNLPIHGYCAVNMGAIPLINDAVGGVEIEVLEDVIYTGMKKGDVLLLKGMDAYYYLHNRDVKSLESAGRRLERQKQYLEAYAAAAMEEMKRDITLPVTLYDKLSKYMVTDLDLDEISYLAVLAADCRFDSGNLHSLEGETLRGERYEEFYVDETALYELILEIFYERIED